MNEIQKSNIEQITLEINFYKQQTAQNIIEIGKRLIQAKEQLAHGEWGKWLEEKVGFSQSTSRKYMQVAREFSNHSALNDLGSTKIFALLSIPKEEREDFIQNNAVESMTTRELQQAVKLQKQSMDRLEEAKEKAEEEARTYKHQQELLLEENKALRNRQPEVKEVPVEVEKVVVPKEVQEELGEAQARNNELNFEISELNMKIADLEMKQRIYEEKEKLDSRNSEKYEALKSQIAQLAKQKDDIGRRISAATELSGLVVEIEEILKNKLAPVKYSRAIKETRNEVVVQNNLRDIVDRVSEWTREMEKLMENNCIDVEVIRNEQFNYYG